MVTYSIKDLENISGIKAHTLRIWEVRYNILTPLRTDTNIRLYSNSDMLKLLNVSLLNNNGVKISKIAKLSNEQISNKTSEILSEEHSFNNQIENLVMAMVEMDEQRFESIVSNNILKFGIEDTLTNIMYPFLIKVGVLWRTNSIYPGQEHFITHLIRQKLISAIDGQVVKLKDNGTKYMLYLPENELHEISLLYYNFLIRKANHKTIYLGQSVPFEDAVRVANDSNCSYVISILTSGIKPKKVSEYVQTLSKELPHKTILLSGYQTMGLEKLNLKNVIFFKNPEELKQHI